MSKSSSDAPEPDTPPAPPRAGESAEDADTTAGAGADAGARIDFGAEDIADNETEYFEYSVAEGTAHFLDLDRGLYVMSWTGSPGPDHSALVPTVAVLPVTDPTDPDTHGRKPAVSIERVGELVFVKVLAGKSRVVVLGTSGDGAHSLKLSRLGHAA